MDRIVFMLVSLLCYAAFLISFLYFIGFVAGYTALPTNVDKGMIASAPVAALVDIVLIALFGAQHSIMARQNFKAAWTRIVPKPLERSVYCLAAAAVLIVLVLFWHPIPAIVWSVESTGVRFVLWSLFALGFGIVFVSTWLINHFELFGLAQTWGHMRGHDGAPPRFRTPLLYAIVRHPLYLGFLIALWATPVMTAGHVLLAAGLSVYILIGIALEERDLIATFGSTYHDYRRRVGMIIPGIGRRRT